MYIDFKITTWERVNVPDAYVDEVLKLVTMGIIENSGDLMSRIDNCALEGMSEVDEAMTPSENSGCATVEVFDDQGEVLYRNGD